MTQNVDTFGEYARRRLEQWGHEFALHRDCEYLGHVSKNMLQVLIEHKGELPARPTGFKPLEVDREAMQIETVVHEMALVGMAPHACVLRAYYCGRGRKHNERYETANLLLANAGHSMMTHRQYRAAHEAGFLHVRGVLLGIALAA